MPEVPVTAGTVAAPHLEAAAHWFVLLADSDTPETRRLWQQWHDAAPAHQQAWHKVEALQSLLAGAPAQTGTLLRQPPPKSRRHVVAGLGAALAAGILAALAPFSPNATTIEWVATARGERREVTLPDGGRVWLGSATRLGIAYSAEARELYLSHGVMQLSSARDAQARPLRIVARDGVVRPLGTRLTLSQFSSYSVLAVQEHAAQVAPLRGPAVRVAAGQRVRFAATGSDTPEPAPVADDAWTRGLVMAMNTPLAEFAEQFSLYSGQPVAVAPAVAQRRVSGTYQIDAPQRSLQTLADVFKLRLEKAADGWRLRPR